MEQNKNTGLFFYRGYYNRFFGEEGVLIKIENLDLKKEAQLKISAEKNKQFKDFKEIELKKHFEVKGTTTFSLTSVYPGIYCGSGYTFGAGLGGEFQMGFLFDHTTGLPYWPGSSVKGAIRSAFPERKKEKKLQKTYCDYIWDEIIKNIILKDPKYHTTNLCESSEKAITIQEIELEIFEGRNLIKEKNKNENKNKYLSIYERDIFHDAYIENSVKKGNTKDYFLGLDYITPHKDNPLKNPIPLPFLKVLPGVEIQFQFKLHDGYYLTKQGKHALFKQILLDFGIGAKTNVGYGQFKE